MVLLFWVTVAAISQYESDGVYYTEQKKKGIILVM